MSKQDMVVTGIVVLVVLWTAFMATFKTDQ